MTDVAVLEGRNFGFVTFGSPQMAQAFLDTRDHIIDGKKIEAKAAVPKQQGGTGHLTNKMFVGGTVCSTVPWYVVHQCVADSVRGV